MNKEGPFYAVFEGETSGVIKQELITYKVKNGMLIKEIVNRDYQDSGNDYTDSSTIIPLREIKNESTT